MKQLWIIYQALLETLDTHQTVDCQIHTNHVISLSIPNQFHSICIDDIYIINNSISYLVFVHIVRYQEDI